MARLQLDDRITSRVFIVGCSRSGTTLLQGMLANHPEVHTFPETGLFLRLRGRRWVVPWVWLNLNMNREGKTLKVLQQQLGAERVREWGRQRRWRQCQAAAGMVGVFDQLALESGKSSWVEKTPRHFLHAAWIARHVPHAHVIHLIRDGRDVVASIVDRAQKHPEHFSRQSDAGYGIRLWNRAIHTTAGLAGEPGHTVLAYEDLVAYPERVMPALCARAGLEFRRETLAPARESGHIRPAEVWKAQSVAGITGAREKSSRLFCPAERDRIRKRLRLPAYQRLRETGCLDW